ncbi:MAG: alanine racemase [Muribaculaceae bacterium]|nr:alanine racemase [Muribaculaceae bacterium]
MIFHINDIARHLGLAEARHNDEVADLMIDSRSVVNPERTLFVALRTPNNDGHAFIPQLIAKGVRNFLVDHIPAGCDSAGEVNFLKVEDTLAALQSIGSLCRGRIKGKVIAITGSRGKTVAKEWIYQSLAEIPGYKVYRSPRSYNSQIGVPLSLWYADPDASLAVIEAGVSKKGEMAALRDMIRPDYGILTDITSEHDDGFASHEEKNREKLELFTDCEIICRGDEIESDDIRDKNITYAKAVLRLMGQPESLAEKGYPVKTRLNVIDGVNNCRLIIDRFTNDILSLRLALDFMRRQVTAETPLTLILNTDGFIGTEDEIARAVSDYGVSRMIKSTDTDLLSLSTDDFYNEAIMLKGHGMESLYTMLEAKQHETLMEVNLDAVIHNFNFFRSKIKPSTGVICMLKAHGYGAGSIELARTLQSQGAAYLAVAVVDEGVELRQAGITMPIMVLNPRAQNYRVMFDYRLEPEIYSFEMLDQIIRSAEKHGVTDFPVHIKLETGMRRLGFVKEDIELLAARLNAAPQIKASTIFSHLACADDPAEDNYTRGQFAYFNQCCDLLDNLLAEKPKRHILNSTGIVRFPEMQYDFVRLGIGLYGVKTLFDGSMDALRNVSSLSSLVISIKHWPAGTTVGYNRRGRLSRDSVIATVPIGYADGIDRHLGYGNARFLINGHRCPTVGSICMDICMIDVTDTPCKVGDRVEIFGDNISPIELSDTLQTIPYEILTSISPRVKRVYYRE